MRGGTDRVLVTGGHALADGIARGLAATGAQVALVGGTPSAGWTPAAVIDCAFSSEDEVADAVAAAETALGGLDQVVHAWIHPRLLGERAFADVTTDEWAEVCEGSLEAAWWLARHLSVPLQRSGGGSVVFCIPSIALTGAAGYSLLATVAEGVRVLAKGCGRQWASLGVTANTVATAPHLWVGPEVGDRLTKAF
jgi:NAD(P)-dependent dehydrogenase (short-subunit alcohol dehydrogenase family)